MRRSRRVALGLALALAACSLSEGKSLDDLLVVTATCRENDACTYRGEDVILDIEIANRGASAVGFPLAFLQGTGPVIRLVDARSKAESHVPKTLADPALKQRLTRIEPGASETLAWVIGPAELEQFGGPRVDVLAEITVTATIEVDGRPVPFRGSHTLRIAAEGQARP